MFGFGKSNKVETTVKLLANAGREASEWFQGENTLQWMHASRWCAFCVTMPAFAYVIAREMMISGSTSLSSGQRSFFKSVEDGLFKLYAQDRMSYAVPIRECLPLFSERQKVCQAFGEDENTLVTMDMVLGIIFPNRLGKYQVDWAAGFAASRVQSPTGYSHSPQVYAAMRLAADLAGIATPQSLAGHTAMGLGIMAFGTAEIVLQLFVEAYSRECP